MYSCYDFSWNFYRILINIFGVLQFIIFVLFLVFFLLCKDIFYILSHNFKLSYRICGLQANILLFLLALFAFREGRRSDDVFSWANAWKDDAVFFFIILLPFASRSQLLFCLSFHRGVLLIDFCSGFSKYHLWSLNQILLELVKLLFILVF